MEESCDEEDGAAANATDEGLGTACAALSSGPLSLLSICLPQRMQVFGPAAVVADDALSSLESRPPMVTLAVDEVIVLLDEGPAVSGKGEEGPGAGAILLCDTSSQGID